MKKKKITIFSILYICIFIILVSGTSFSYFTVINGSNITKNHRIETAVLPSLIFEMNGKIDIKADPYNFSLGKGSITSKSNVKAILKNGTVNEIAEAHYKLSIVIDKNDFEYMNEKRTPEIIFNIKDYNNKILDNINGLEYVHNKNGSGFDITNKTGEIVICEDCIIRSKDTSEQNWELNVTLVNLDEIQDHNTNKKLVGRFKIENLDNEVYND